MVLVRPAISACRARRTRQRDPSATGPRLAGARRSKPEQAMIDAGGAGHSGDRPGKAEPGDCTRCNSEHGPPRSPPRPASGRRCWCETGGMVETHLVSTSAGLVEVVQVPGEKPPVLFFPGGHCSAQCECGWDLYAALGHGIVSFSRPVYGRTRVGALSPGAFAPLVREVCEQLGIGVTAAVVGVSFGGMQAVHVSVDRWVAASRLVLHSCAPSGLPYPDTLAEAIGGRVIFAPLVQGLTWSLLRSLIRSDAGLRLVMERLSKLPVEEWWDQQSAADREQARSLFRSMRSGSGFVNDLRQARKSGGAVRSAAMRDVRCPTLVTGSPHDGGVSYAHSRDFATAIPGATLVELDSPSHLFWIGPGRPRLMSIISAFVDHNA